MPDNNPKNLRIEDFHYNLPDDRIALFPKDIRDESRLLICRNSQISADVYSSLPKILPAGCRLVFNNTRVIQARLKFQKPTGAMIEIFLLEPENESGGLEAAINSKARTKWKCLIGGAGKWKPGQVMTMMREGICLEASIAAKNIKNFTVEFSWKPADLTFSEVLSQTGNIPIPPYLKRNPQVSDEERYQTVFAERQGSVAAPTAGLHFTDKLLENLDAAQIAVSYLTLHVGAGTFLPVKSEKMEGHAMHGEFIDVGSDTIRELAGSVGKLFAVGTTSLRTLESLYWMGIKTFLNPDIQSADLWITQWEIYEELGTHETDPVTALTALLTWMEKNDLQRLMTKTEILIAPPYHPKMIMGLITNFHQPNSTLLLLVAAVIGEEWKNVYNYALDNNFRFLSYGDGCLLYTN